MTATKAPRNRGYDLAFMLRAAQERIRDGASCALCYALPAALVVHRTQPSLRGKTQHFMTPVCRSCNEPTHIQEQHP